MIEPDYSLELSWRSKVGQNAPELWLTFRNATSFDVNFVKGIFRVVHDHGRDLRVAKLRTVDPLPDRVLAGQEVQLCLHKGRRLELFHMGQADGARASAARAAPWDISTDLGDLGAEESTGLEIELTLTSVGIRKLGFIGRMLQGKGQIEVPVHGSIGVTLMTKDIGNLTAPKVSRFRVVPVPSIREPFLQVRRIQS